MKGFISLSLSRALQRIADHIGVPRPTLAQWFVHNGVAGKVNKRGNNVHNIKAGIMNKPQRPELAISAWAAFPGSEANHLSQLHTSAKRKGSGLVFSAEIPFLPKLSRSSLIVSRRSAKARVHFGIFAVFARRVGLPW